MSYKSENKTGQDGVTSPVQFSVIWIYENVYEAKMPPSISVDVMIINDD